jgi:hypothetical protein
MRSPRSLARLSFSKGRISGRPTSPAPSNWEVQEPVTGGGKGPLCSLADSGEGALAEVLPGLGVRRLPARAGTGKCREPANAEESIADQTGEADIPAADEAGAGAGRMAMSEVRVTGEPAGPSQDQEEPIGKRCTRKSRDPVRALPPGGARAALLLTPRGQSVQQAQTAKEVNAPPAVISKVNSPRSLASNDRRAREVERNKFLTSLPAKD